MFFLLLAYTAAGQHTHLLNKTDWERLALLRNKQGDILSYDSIKAFGIINSIKQTAKDGKDKALALDAEYILADYYLRGIQKDVPRGIAMMEPLIERAKKEKLHHAEARMRHHFATMTCHTDNDAAKCLHSYLQALSIANRFPNHEFPEKLTLLHQIAGLYYRFGENIKARHYALRAIEKADFKVPEYLYHKYAAMNTIGLSYRNEGKYDSALFYFHRASHSLSTTKDSVWRGETWKAITKGNIGITYMMQGNFAKAKPLLEEDVRFCIAGKEYDNALNSLLKLSEIAFLEKDTAKASRILIDARRLCLQSRDTFTPLQNIYRQLYYIAIWQDNNPLALRYADSLMVIRDSLIKKEKSVMVVREALYEQELDHHKEQEIIATRHDREVWLRNIAILLLGTGGGIIVHLLNKRRLHHKAQKNVLTQRKALTDKALQYAREELQAFTRTISEKNMLIERMTAELNRDADQLSEDADIAVREGNTDLLLQLQQSILLTDEQWEDFQLLFEQAYPGYLANLNKKHSNLTPAETRYILLLKLRLSQKEMAAMLGISPSSIRIYRHRLRKKLQLGEDANLEELAENI